MKPRTAMETLEFRREKGCWDGSRPFGSPEFILFSHYVGFNINLMVIFITFISEINIGSIELGTEVLLELQKWDTYFSIQFMCFVLCPLHFWTPWGQGTRSPFTCVKLQLLTLKDLLGIQAHLSKFTEHSDSRKSCWNPALQTGVWYKQSS